MKTSLMHTLMVAILAPVGMQAFAADALMLSDAQMDTVTAGGQYSVVYGTASADVGIVSVITNAKFIADDGTTMTKADVKVKGDGTGLVGFAIGESAAGDDISGALGEVYVDQGKLMIRIKTMSKIRDNGNTSTKTKVMVKASGAGAQTYQLTY